MCAAGGRAPFKPGFTLLRKGVVGVTDKDSRGGTHSALGGRGL